MSSCLLTYCTVYKPICLGGKGPLLPAWLFFCIYSCKTTTQSKFTPCLCTPLTVPLSAYPVASTSLSAYSSGYVSPISSCLAYSPGLSRPVRILPCFYVPIFLLPYLYLPYLPTSMVISPVCLLAWLYYIPLSAFSPGHIALSAYYSPGYIPRSAYSPGFVPLSAYSPVSKGGYNVSTPMFISPCLPTPLVISPCLPTPLATLDSIEEKPSLQESHSWSPTAWGRGTARDDS